MRIFPLLLSLLLFAGGALAQNYTKRIDSLLATEAGKTFNGVILIAENGKPTYEKVSGYADMEQKTRLKISDAFVIGSVSKQITAVLLLREYDRGRLDLHVPIRKYLPELTYSWVDTVTTHQLMTHTHGINEADPSKPLKFRPGTQFEYNQYGFYLLSLIVEQLEHKPFKAVANEFFKDCNMKYTHYPYLPDDRSIVQGYEYMNGKKKHLSQKEIFELQLDDTTAVTAKPKVAIAMTFVPAGAFVSTAGDMLKWNQLLHNGKLLQPKTYELMITKHENAVRQHPLFGPTTYGYGITVNDDKVRYLGQTGRVPGFSSINFYFPATKMSMVILCNDGNDPRDGKNTFRYHMAVLDIMKQELGNTK